MSRTGRRLYLLFGVVVAVIAVAIGLAVLARGAARRRAKTGVEVVAVARRDISSTIQATGIVNPMVGAEVKVGCRISGRVERLYVNVGDRVSRNQVIAEIEKRDLEAQVAEKRAALAAAQGKQAALEHQQPGALALKRADLAAAEAARAALAAEAPKEAAVAQAGVGAARASLWPALQGEASSGYGNATGSFRGNAAVGAGVSVPLFSGQAFSGVTKAKRELELVDVRSRNSIEGAAIGVTKAESALALEEATQADDRAIAQSEVDQAAAALSAAEVQLTYATIRAPIPGIVASVATQEGENVAAGLSAPTFVTIIDLDRLQVDAYVDETDIGKVEVGQEATFTVDTYADADFRGRVTAIYPKAVIQDNVVDYDVTIAIDDLQGKVLRPEMTANVAIYLGTHKGVLAVPSRAITRDHGEKSLTVLEGSRPVERRVQTGWSDGGYTEIDSGVSDGERIIVSKPEE